MTERFVVIDFEATGREPAEAHIVEYAAIVIEPPWFGSECDRVEISGLVRPPIPIPPETSAIHHIIDADVADMPTWDIASAALVDALTPSGVIAVAHNAEYERTVLNKSGDMPNVRWLCTYKAALRVWPDAPSHSNEALRYFLGMGTGRSGHQATHSALHDARVTAGLLSELLRLNTPIADMLQWTNEPAMLPRCPIGDWRGHPWAEVEYSFLRWILSKPDMRADVSFCAQKEIQRREAEAESEAAKRRAARASPEEQELDSDIPF